MINYCNWQEEPIFKHYQTALHITERREGSG